MREVFRSKWRYFYLKTLCLVAFNVP